MVIIQLDSEQLNSVIENACQRAVRKVLTDHSPNRPTTTDEEPVSTDEAAKRFGIAKQTLYQNARKIKHTKRFGRLYFYPSDLREYLNTGEGVSRD